MDFWVYQEIICEQRPDVIVEIGNRFGGSTLALAHLLDTLGQGRIIGVDIDHSHVPDVVFAHERVSLIQSDALDAYQFVRERIFSGENVLLIEDSAHTYENTLGVLERYSDLIQSGGYIIVEDTICHHGLDVGPNPGPWEAVETFLAERSDFVLDRDRESFVITWNPKGFLKRV